MLLRHAGYEVAEIYSWGEAHRLLRSEIFNLLLICHTVPQDQREALIEEIHFLRPQLRFLCLTAE
jgi:DNA-binding NtrC family response regulator